MGLVFIGKLGWSEEVLYTGAHDGDNVSGKK
jgi:hypothetical protein